MKRSAAIPGGACLAIAALVALFTSGSAAAAAHILDIDNRVPKFEAFYRDATAKPLGEEARFRLWQKEDGLAAVPPGAQGESMARKLLDAAWSKYPGLLPRLRTLTADAQRTAREMFEKDNALLGTGKDGIRVRLILYVGQFDNNAFTVPPMNGKPATVLMPVENSNLRIALAHELTHAIHLQLIHAKNSFGAPVGETMFLEGLAMRTSQRAVPNLADAAYVAMPGDKQWFARCKGGKDAILRSIAPDLGKSGSDVAMKYTFGKGNTGLEREAYCAAWFVMGSLIASGKTLPQLARIPENRMVPTIRAEMRRMGE